MVTNKVFAYVVLFLKLAFLTSCNSLPDKLDWAAVDYLITSDFPDVPHLTTIELAELLSNAPETIILLDAREAEEFSVSHLPGAHHVAAKKNDAALLAAAAPDAIVVVYCSVGYRSAALVKQLHTLGQTHAVNLKGSIFRWASEGRPVYRGNTRVDQVHPYDDTWGVLLPEPFWAFESEP